MSRRENSGLVEGVKALWRDEVLVDYTIEVEDAQFKVHKVAMVGVSDYFKVMLTGGMAESQTDRVRLEGLSSLVVSNVIEYIYTGQFGKNQSPPVELLSCAVYLQYPSAKRAAAEKLFKSLNVNNCFDILSTFKTFFFENYVTQTLSYIKSFLDKIIQVSTPDEMSYDAFINLMEFWGKSEWDNYQSVIKWITNEPEDRKQHLNSLMDQIHFAVMTPDELAKVKQSETFANSKGSWCELVDKATLYHNLPTHLKVLCESGQNVVRDEPIPVCFTVNNDHQPRDFYAMKDGKSWTKHESTITNLQNKTHSLGFDKPAAVVVVNNYLIVCTAFCTNQSWHIFDPRTLEWSSMANMIKQRGDFALVNCGNKLYALGGHVGTADALDVTDEIEEYDFTSDTWCLLPLTLPVARHSLHAVELGGLIYVFGGWRTGNKSIFSSDSLDCFDPTTGKWESKEPIPEAPEAWHKVCVAHLGDNTKFIFVIREAFWIWYNSTEYDYWHEWRYDVDYLVAWAEGCTVLCSGNVFFFLNGR